MTAARAQGLDYLGITLELHRSASGGFDLRRFDSELSQLEAFEAGLQAQANGFGVLRGVCVAIRSDGTLDVPAGFMSRFGQRLDVVTAAVRDGFDVPREQQTTRLLRALDQAALNQAPLGILAHPTGRRIGVQPPMQLDLARVMQAARDRGVALEVNADPLRLDLDDAGCRLAREVGVMLSIASDARDPSQLARIGWGVGQARRGWVPAQQVINTRPLAQVRRLPANARAMHPMPLPQPPSLAPVHHERTFHDL